MATDERSSPYGSMLREPTGESKSLNPERSVSVENSVKQPMEISSEALELLRRAALPVEFLKITQEFTPGAEVLLSSAPEDFLAPTEIVRPLPEMPYQAEGAEGVWPEESVEPKLEIVNWPEMPVEILKEEPADGGANMFTLTALTVDLSGVAHSTPGLDAWEGTTLGRFVTNT